MPFFDDSGPRVEMESEPVGRTFALLREQLERMIVLNLLWVAQGLPLVLAWAFAWPEAIRLACTFYSALAIPPATTTLLAVLRAVSAGEPLGVALLQDSVRAQIRPGMLKLMPLYSLFFWLILLAQGAAAANLFALDVAARLALLLLLPASFFWGPLIVAKPTWPICRVFLGAASLFWRYPGRTLVLCGLCVAALALGAASIAGMVLIVPVVVMLFQTEFYQTIESRGTRGN